jgi:hypothetical protein
VGSLPVHVRLLRPRSLSNTKQGAKLMKTNDLYPEATRMEWYLRSPAGVVVMMSKESAVACFHEELYKLMLQM